MIITNSNIDTNKLNTLLKNYIAPSYILTFHSTHAFPLQSNFNNSPDYTLDEFGNTIVQYLIITPNNADTV